MAMEVDPLKMYFLLNLVTFHCYVSLAEGISYLGGGFKYFLFSPQKLGKIPILTNVFHMGGSTTSYEL